MTRPCSAFPTTWARRLRARRATAEAAISSSTSPTPRLRDPSGVRAPLCSCSNALSAPRTKEGVRIMENGRQLLPAYSLRTPWGQLFIVCNKNMHDGPGLWSNAGSTGLTNIKGLTIGGMSVAPAGIPNEQLSIAGQSVILNEQIQTANGIIVNALHIRTLDGLTDVRIGSTQAGI